MKYPVLARVLSVVILLAAVVLLVFVLGQRSRASWPLMMLAGVFSVALAAAYTLEVFR